MSLPASAAAQLWLAKAVHKAGIEQADLWVRGVGERARVAHVFRYMCDLVPSDWNVDFEYNRERSDPKTAPPSAGSPSGLGTPDLVVHRRGQDHSQNNLLVAEFKITHSNQHSESRDVQKVRYWVDTFGYQVGAVIGFGPNGGIFNPNVIWIRATGTTQTARLMFDS